MGRAAAGQYPATRGWLSADTASWEKEDDLIGDKFDSGFILAAHSK